MIDLSFLQERTVNITVSSDNEDFYISYNFGDRNIYGCDTTAIVTGQYQHFYILDGNHLNKYKELLPRGLNACLEYFKNNINLINKYSEKMEVTQ